MSSISLGWQVFRHARDREDIRISTADTVVFSHETGRVKEIVFAVNVTNHGARPVTVRDVAWRRFGEPSVWYSPHGVGTWTTSGPSLPHRLDGLDCATWSVTDQFMERFKPGDMLFAEVMYVNSRKGGLSSHSNGPLRTVKSDLHELNDVADAKANLRGPHGHSH
jgi:hypothetical protein